MTKFPSDVSRVAQWGRVVIWIGLVIAAFALGQWWEATTLKGEEMRAVTEASGKVIDAWKARRNCKDTNGQ